MGKIVNVITGAQVLKRLLGAIIFLPRHTITAPSFFMQCAACKIRYGIRSLEELKKKIKISGNRYFLMRHGESVSNTLGINHSTIDKKYPLTFNGRESAQKGAEEAAAIRPDLIFTSPLQRAIETAEIVARRIRLPQVQIIIDNRLRVPHFGIFEGKTVAEYNAHFSSLEQKIFETPQGGESMLDCRKYATEFLYDIDMRYSNKKILIISHSGTLWMLSAGARGAGVRETVALRGEASKKFLAKGEVRELLFMPLPHNKNFELALNSPFVESTKFICSQCGGEMRCMPNG